MFGKIISFYHLIIIKSITIIELRIAGKWKRADYRYEEGREQERGGACLWGWIEPAMLCIACYQTKRIELLRLGRI